MIALSVVCFTGAVVGISLYLVQLGATRRHLRRAPAGRARARAISILKPLCGLDDELAANLEHFATLRYPHYEVVLGVRDTGDAAWPIAVAAARRWPARVRVVLQRGEPGLNPKVNQLVTLAAAARHDVLVVSDSNVRVDDDYLWEIAALLDDAAVGLVTHPVVGVGESRLGSLMDNLHLAGSVGAGMIGAKNVAGKDIVVGKSMALRRRDLDALGGFAAVADVLAEDYVMGKMVGTDLRKRVVVGRRPVENVSRDRSVREFYHRYRRWAVIHRQAVGGPIYTAQILLNPTAVALCAFALHPSAATLGGLGTLGAIKIVYDMAALRIMRGGVPWRALWASPLKDLVLAAAWIHGLTRREIVWRGNRLRVLAGTRLSRNHEAREPVDGVHAELAADVAGGDAEAGRLHAA
jgi:ceramide glucosyltransferase